MSACVLKGLCLMSLLRLVLMLMNVWRIMEAAIIPVSTLLDQEPASKIFEKRWEGYN